MAGNTNTLVVDASVILSLLLPDESRTYEIDDYFEQFKNGEINFISSELLHFEVINSLTMAYRRNRISLEYCQQRIKEFQNYNIAVRNVDFQKVFLLAIKNNLTIYDASYLYLALSEDVGLLTLDSKLASAL